ncbi:hypothetical protein CDAR_18771 [Caerostris darwini]|uniref:Uncharacterized protein n=1 Tax=Caerostris darwini TaxID=1538125 RepID=A0AAV4WCF8_9ARAC|nr:hypothetical protein CDAR_18771 [Caerostris darwini]
MQIMSFRNVTSGLSLLVKNRFRTIPFHSKSKQKFRGIHPHSPELEQLIPVSSAFHCRSPDIQSSRARKRNKRHPLILTLYSNPDESVPCCRSWAEDF